MFTRKKKGGGNVRLVPVLTSLTGRLRDVVYLVWNREVANGKSQKAQLNYVKTF